MLRFSNKIDPNSLDRSKITVTPYLPDLAISIKSAKTLQLSSALHDGDVVYKVVIDHTGKYSVVNLFMYENSAQVISFWTLSCAGRLRPVPWNRAR